MTYEHIIHLKKKRKNSKVQEVTPEWEEYKDWLFRKKKLIAWNRSDWDSDGCATIHVVTDKRETWIDLVDKSSLMHKNNKDKDWYTNAVVTNKVFPNDEVIALRKKN